MITSAHGSVNVTLTSELCYKYWDCYYLHKRIVLVLRNSINKMLWRLFKNDLKCIGPKDMGENSNQSDGCYFAYHLFFTLNEL